MFGNFWDTPCVGELVGSPNVGELPHSCDPFGSVLHADSRWLQSSAGFQGSETEQRMPGVCFGYPEGPDILLSRNHAGHGL